MKQINFDKNVRELLIEGVDRLNEAVSSTLGARGSNVILQTGSAYGVTKDGVTVAMQVESNDPIENAAIQIVKEAASRTARDAGDGTTTATVIASSMIKDALMYVGNGAKRNDVRRGMEYAVESALKYIDSMKQEVDGDEDIYNIARISANNDPVLGRMVADIFKKVGKTGAVRLEETQMNETVVDTIEGCQINSGMLSPNFANQNNGAADYKETMIIVTDKKFDGAFSELVPALDLIIEHSEKIKKTIPILIICGGMEGETLRTLVLNKIQKKFPIVAITAPDMGDKRMEILDDIATITGATVLSDERGFGFDSPSLDFFGTADRVIVDKEFTTILGRHGEKKDIDIRVNEIEDLKVKDRNNMETWRLDRRIATLTGGIGVIYVGGNSNTEMKETYYRLEDALSATKASLESGFVTGGGIAYLSAGKSIKSPKKGFFPPHGQKDFDLGVGLVVHALSMPMRTIVKNAGISGSVVFEKLSMSGNKFGYDVMLNEYGDMIKRGIIDPTKVAKSAIQNAVSVAIMLLTTNCAITNKKE